MTLYLATFALEKYEYMGRTKRGDPQIRLIRAEGVDEAEQKLKAEVERNDPYATSYYVVDLDITAIIE
jgi:hypothetical protein